MQEIKPRIWIHVKTVSDLWQICFDGKYEYIDAISLSVPLYDKGWLGALRMLNIHKSLCLRKFERYIVTYGIVGSFVRGQATKTSDIDVFVIVDDTDVKRMTRTELVDKLRSIMHSYVFSATDMAHVKNKLHIQTYILTEFWNSVREAHPVIFTFIRDGVPLYDRGTFMPWKLLLEMGQITGTPEAIDRFLAIEGRASKIIREKLKDIVIEDIYLSVLLPSQGALMLFGYAPPTHRETVELMKKVFVEKEKLLEKRYVDFLAKVVELFKAHEKGKMPEIKGKDIDNLVKQMEDYNKRLKQLIEEIDKRKSEKTVVELYQEVMNILKIILGKGSEKQLLQKFEKELVKTGCLPSFSLKQLHSIIKSKKDYTKGKLTRHEVDVVRKDGSLLIKELTEYVQRKKLAEAKKTKS